MTTLIPKFQQTGTGAANRAINLKLAESVSVKDFGAVSDGSGITGTDNTTAFTNALNSGALKVVVPSGSYLIDTIAIPSNVTLDLTGATLLMKAHTTSHNPMIRIGTSTTAVSNATVIGGTLVGNSASQTYAGEEWSPAIMIWGSDYNKVIGAVITDCKGDGITIGFDSGRLVGSNANTIDKCRIYLNTRNGIAVTYGNENTISNNKVSGNIDLELDASIGECKNNLVIGNTGNATTENLTKPRISDLAILLASLNTDPSNYSGNIVSNNNCFSIGLQYNSYTIITGNVITGSTSSQARLIYVDGSPYTSITNNTFIANSVLATSLVDILRTRGSSYLTVTNNTVSNDALPFDNYVATFGALTAAANSQFYYGNVLSGTGAYRSGNANCATEYVRFRVDQVNGGTLTATQVGGACINGVTVVRSGSDLQLSDIGSSGTVYTFNIETQCNATTSSATNMTHNCSYTSTRSGSSAFISMYTFAPTGGAVSLSAFSFASGGGTGTFFIQAWY